MHAVDLLLILLGHRDRCATWYFDKVFPIMFQTHPAHSTGDQMQTPSFPSLPSPSAINIMMSQQFDAFARAQGDLDAVVREACWVAAEGVGTWFAGRFQHCKDAQALVLQAGVGCPAWMIRRTRVAASLETTAGLAWLTGQLIHFRRLDRIYRIQVPELMDGHRICRMAIVPIQGECHVPFGILEIGSPDVEEFAPHDLHFLQLLARSVAIAVNRHASLMRWAVHAAEALGRDWMPVIGG